MKTNTKQTVLMGLFAAISIILVALIHFPIIPSAAFLEYDPADIPILLCTFLYGPLSGFLLTVVVSVIQGVTVSAASGPIGIMMHVFATGSFVLVAGNVYNRFPTMKGSVGALAAGIVTWILSMVIWNLVFTPIFMGTPREAVVALMPAIILFNMIKAGANGILAFAVYHILRKRGIGRQLTINHPQTANR